MFTQLNKEGTSPSFYRWRCWSIEVGWLAQGRQSQESTQRLLLSPGSSVTYPFSYGRDIAGEPVPCLACTDQTETFQSPPRSIYEVRPISFVSCLPRPIPVEARKAITPGLLTMEGLILSSLTSLLLRPYAQSQRDTNKVGMDYLYRTVWQQSLSAKQCFFF